MIDPRKLPRGPVMATDCRNVRAHSWAPLLYRYDDLRLRPEAAERVEVKRPDALPYKTDFARCYTCCAMYHWPDPMPVVGTGSPCNPESLGRCDDGWC